MKEQIIKELLKEIKEMKKFMHGCFLIQRDLLLEMKKLNKKLEKNGER